VVVVAAAATAVGVASASTPAGLELLADVRADTVETFLTAHPDWAGG
jgi:hypothetical protein